MGYWDAEEKLQTLVGRKLKSVSLSADKGTLTVEAQDGQTLKFGVEGDCCSHSWIEHLETPKDLDGATVIECSNQGVGEIDSGDEYECLRGYQTIIQTDKGEITMEYRNSSNGYYGGYLVYLGDES